MKVPNLFHRKDLLHTGALLFLYFITARIGLSLGAVNGVATVVWPPTGIALAALLIYGYRCFPGIILGALLANLSIGVPFFSSVGISIGNTLEALIGAYLLQRFIQFNNSLERLTDVLGLIGFAAILSCLVSATVGTTSSWLGGVIPSGNYCKAWLTWYLGDMMGDLIIAPVLLTWSKPLKLPIAPRKILEGSFLLLFLGLSCYLIFSHFLLPYPLTFLIFPFLIWAALRFGPRGASLATFIASILTILYTQASKGPFNQSTLSESLALVQIFMGVLSITTLLLAATVSQRRLAEKALRKSEKQIRMCIDNALEAIIIMNADGAILDWNPYAEKIFGWKREEMLSQIMAEKIIPIKYRQLYKNELRTFLKTGKATLLNKQVEFTALHRNGYEFPIELSLSAMKFGKEYMFSAFLRDITERKRTEEALKQEIEKLQGASKG